MNKRIFELAKQADLIQWDTLTSGARTPDHESVVKAKKFAELIVKECLKVSYNSADMLKSTNPAYSDGIMSNNLAIREHFGVEE
jgi:hypothetical protein